MAEVRSQAANGENAFQEPASARARDAYALVCQLQENFANGLAHLSGDGPFAKVSWLRDEGRHGGGHRLCYGGGDFYNRASVNVSQVHYDDMADKRLGSANALSTIVHPSHPQMPSIHIHISLTEMKSGDAYWRVMGDLNPSVVDEGDKAFFFETLRNVTGEHFDAGTKCGDRYFFIPVLQRHRGVAHFYLESFRTDDAAADRKFAESFGEAVTRTYVEILEKKRQSLGAVTSDEKKQQLDYHTLYLLQVLTLDRGTTSGLLVHDQNDVGILGSLPAVIDLNLLKSWVAKMPKPQDELLQGICEALPENGAVEDAQKRALCQVVRKHYGKHPQALDMQARGDVVPETVLNHNAK